MERYADPGRSLWAAVTDLGTWSGGPMICRATMTLLSRDLPRSKRFDEGCPGLTDTHSAKVSRRRNFCEARKCE